MLYHREHTILLSGKRCFKGMKKIYNLPLSTVVISDATNPSAVFAAFLARP